MRKTRTLLEQVRARVRTSADRVFILKDFADLVKDYDYDQVLRALRQLVKEQILAKVGQGIYAKMRLFSDGKIRLTAPLGNLAREALEKLGIRTFDSLYTQANKLGLTTQVPTGRRIGVQQRVRRLIIYNDYEISYENIPRNPDVLRARLRAL